ncbi:MAG: hypothetical protein GY805_32295 [Chloroflexi bacterium]|nr:hypothetical protein [Chloroflexota bacterium]
MHLNLPQQVYPVKYTDNAGRAVFEISNELLDGISNVVIRKEGYQTQTHILMLANAPLFTTYLVPIGATAVPRETPTATPIPATPRPDDTNTPVPTDTAVPTSTLQPTATHTSTPVPSTDTVTVIRREGSETVYVLAGPDVINERLGTLAANESGTVIGRTSGNEWLQIVTSRGVQGWVADCEITLSIGTLSAILITWDDLVTAKNCAGEGSSSGSEFTQSGSCVTVSLSFTEWPTRYFDDVLLSWSNVPSTASRLKLWITGPNEDGETAFIIDPTFSDVDIFYKVEVFKFEEGGFIPDATYTYVVQPFNAANQIICTTQGTFVP